MARAVRVEFAGAFYHVMARGDRREPIVRDDADRATLVRTLAEASERSGFRVHAFVLMSNHYHLLLETPQANLSQGMGWLQNAFTRRINTRHRLWGHLFGGRYKAILVEPGNCFWALLDYIHLNPVRAGIVAEKDGLESYVWSSLPHYFGPPRKRPAWLETVTGFEVCGCDDTARGRREFLGLLEQRVDWRNPRLAGTTFPEGNGSRSLRCTPACGGDGSLVRSASAKSYSGCLPSGRLESKRPMATTARSSTTTPRSELAHSFGQPWNTLAPTSRPCGGLAREIGAKGCLRR